MDTSTSQYTERQPPENFHHASMQGEVGGGASRYAQIREETSHRNCSEGNQKALLVERLNGMRSLLKDLNETNWMFDEKNVEKDAPQPLGKGVERHFSLGRRI
jgi:hypothetical protein